MSSKNQHLLVLYRPEHKNTFHSALEKYLNVDIDIIEYPDFVNISYEAKLNLYFISLVSIWEKIMYLNYCNRENVTIYYFQHGLLLRGNRIIIHPNYLRKFLFLLPIVMKCLPSFLKLLYIKKMDVDFGVLWDPESLYILSAHHNLRFKSVKYDYWLFDGGQTTVKRDILFIHENFVSAKMTKLSRKEEIEFLDELYVACSLCGFNLDIAIHPMDRDKGFYNSVKGNLFLIKSVETVLHNYRIVIGVSSSAFQYAEILDIKILRYNFYKMKLIEIDEMYCYQSLTSIILDIKKILDVSKS